MKLSLNFVKDYIDIDEDVKVIAEKMTKVGNEYEEAGKYKVTFYVICEGYSNTQFEIDMIITKGKTSNILYINLEEAVKESNSSSNFFLLNNSPSIISNTLSIESPLLTFSFLSKNNWLSPVKHWYSPSNALTKKWYLNSINEQLFLLPNVQTCKKLIVWSNERFNHSDTVLISIGPIYLFLKIL